MLSRFLFKGCGQLSSALGGLVLTQVAVLRYVGLPTPPPNDPVPTVTQAIVVERVAPHAPIVPARRPQVFYNQQRHFHHTLHLRGVNPSRSEVEGLGPVLEAEPFLHRPLITQYDINNDHAHLLAEIFNNPYGLNWMAMMVRLGINLNDQVQGYEGIHEGCGVVGFLKTVPITYLELLISLGYYDLAALFLEIPVSAASSVGDDVYDPILDSSSFYTLLAHLQEAMQSNQAIVPQGMERLLLAAIVSDVAIDYMGIDEHQRYQITKSKRSFVAALLQSSHCNLLDYPEVLVNCLFYAIGMHGADLELFHQMLNTVQRLSNSQIDWLGLVYDRIREEAVGDLNENGKLKGAYQDALLNIMQMMHPASPLATQYAQSLMRLVLSNKKSILMPFFVQYESLSDYYNALLEEYDRTDFDEEAPVELRKE